MKLKENRYSRIFGSYDIRRVVVEDLDTPTVMATSPAYGEYLCPRQPGHFVIGHDDRWSSAALSEAASVGLRQLGHKVIHIGLSSTPMVYWYGAEGGFDGSITISASHLPPNYNGLKLCSILAGLEAQFRDGQVGHLDGLSVDYPGWWFNIRPSHTEPVLRLNIGANSETLLKKKRDSLLDQIKKIKPA